MLRSTSYPHSGTKSFSWVPPGASPGPELYMHAVSLEVDLRKHWYREGKEAEKAVSLWKLLLWKPGLNSTREPGNRLGHSSELSFPSDIG